MAIKGKKAHPQALAKDVNNNIINGGDAPIDHERFLREVISKNASGEVCRIDRIYDDGDGGEVTFRKRIEPPNGEIIDSVVTFHAWVEV